MKTKTPDMAPVQFSGDGEIIVGTWSEGVGLRIRVAAGTIDIRLPQLAAFDLADQIRYAGDVEDDQLPVF